ncbi:MAG: radical SAM protein [Candidatus Abyssobacteria bacterium SURF_17]|uniref:Radical SAM protein n=1 Tax=Candidatus Abyssobacteria bacterium SURF_17 TaxID=2093361 RepID=A0A419EX22_9BACT|nr:MAG: radical SAM protein [Candidatus Abyssubacteria bacterium SURF_17]
MAATCINCGKNSRLISSPLSVCARCIKADWDTVQGHISSIHATGRARFGLPSTPPRTASGLECRFCMNKCSIPAGESGYCGFRKHRQTPTRDRLEGGTDTANVSWYHDPLPTNCVADWVCPGGTGSGHPAYAHSKGPEHGYKNLAVFFRACSFDCLFCQNWHYRLESTRDANATVDDLVHAVDERTSCICFFGGDPSPQLPFSIAASARARRKNSGRILRICWETNGSMNPPLLKKMAKLSLESGGCIKFDLKAWDERLHIALCGVSNRQTLANFTALAEMTSSRQEPPPLVANTLLVPGYIDEAEVRNIASFIAELNPHIPYSLLAFHPQFMMEDLPVTSRRHAEACHEAALSAGLKRVRIGNIHLLTRDHY